MTDYQTERGALLARVEWGKTEHGYMVEGYNVVKRRGTWRVDGTSEHFATMTDALRWLVDHLENEQAWLDGYR